MTGKLRTDPRIDDPDGFYAALIALHDGLDDDQSAQVNAALILLLANHIGDRQTLDEALTIARKDIEHPA